MEKNKNRKKNTEKIVNVMNLENEEPETDSIMNYGTQETTNEQAQTDIRIEQVCGAWKNADEVASDIWCSIHNSLLEGQLVFAYKSTTPGTDLTQLVVVKNQDETFGVGLMTSGHTELLPRVPFKYLENNVRTDLKNYKVPKSVIDNYNYMIEIFK